MRYMISPQIHSTVGWLMVASIVVLSLTPPASLPEVTPGFDDKLAHGLIYSVLMAWFAVAAASRVWGRIALWILALGVGLEFCQAFIPYRTGSFGDVFANSAGVLLGAIIAYTLTTGSHRSGRAK